MKSKSPAFQFYVRDWLCSGKVARMSGDEVKAYVYLLAQAWLEEPRATLPDCDHELSLMARVSCEQWTRIKEKVRGAFIVDGDRLVSERLLAHSEDSYRRATNGNKGGNPNFSKGKPNPYNNRKDNLNNNRGGILKDKWLGEGEGEA